MTTKTRSVTIETAAVGEAFGCVAVIRDARTHRRIATTPTVRPHGLAAIGDARALAAARGWTVVDADDNEMMTKAVTTKRVRVVVPPGIRAVTMHACVCAHQHEIVVSGVAACADCACALYRVRPSILDSRR